MKLILLVTEKLVQETINVTDLSRADRYSNGSLRVDVVNDGDLLFVKMIEKKENK